ncbi:MAG TPA: hypothetical protein VEV61_13990 [Streptosporangiaceae bacterium]|nr:hypothetical protein [Streptosporangiaceae bacterium]
MLEDELRELFSAQARASLPPDRISLPAVRRRAAARRHRRDLAALGSPILAACAVLAVALAGLVPFSNRGNAGDNRGNGTQQHAACGQVTAAHASGSSGDGIPGQAAQSSVRAPSQFSLLVPFATFGWLPGDTCRLSGSTSFAADSVIVQGFALQTFANGVCYRMAGKPELACPSVHGYHFQLDARAPAVNGHAAYFVQKAPQAALAWQYAPGGWAILWNSWRQPLRTMLRVADRVMFGDLHQQPIRFAVQITRPPADVNGVVKIYHYYLRFGALLADYYAVFRSGANRSVVMISVGGKCPSGPVQHTIINGYRVVHWSHQEPSGQSTNLCSEARGLRITLEGPSSPSATSALTIFRSLKILGTIPANWVTQPIG